MPVYMMEHKCCICCLSLPSMADNVDQELCSVMDTGRVLGGQIRSKLTLVMNSIYTIPYRHSKR